LIIAAVLLVALPAQAQTQLELNFQARDRAKVSDAALNVRYQQVMKSLSGPLRVLLTAAELKWIAFRDAECDHEEDQYRGGSIMQLIYWNANSLLTEQRTRDLALLTPGPDDPEADKRLNKVYRAWDKEQDAQGHKLLQKAELAWIAFRDAEAAYEGARFKGGKAGCLARLTMTRALDLEALMKERRSH
jgi:uncharacterized protein YecT (DUF1311 family)